MQYHATVMATLRPGGAGAVRDAPGPAPRRPRAPVTVAETGPAPVRLERWRMFEGWSCARGVRGVERPLGGPGGDGGRRPPRTARPTSATAATSGVGPPGHRPLVGSPPPAIVIAVDDPRGPTSWSCSSGTWPSPTSTPRPRTSTPSTSPASSTPPSPSSGPATASSSPSGP
jgi:hypothetical protein